MTEQTWRCGPPPPDDGITDEALRPLGWGPGKYLARACDKCGEPHADCDKRSRKCRPCAVASLRAMEAVRPCAPEEISVQIQTYCFNEVALCGLIEDACKAGNSLPERFDDEAPERMREHVDAAVAHLQAGASRA